MMQFATPGRGHSDVVVVGGGLVGCLIARAVAADGHRVLLLERGTELGREASSAAAGMLSPQMEAAEGLLVEEGPDAARRREAMLELCLAARRLYPAFVAALQSETGLGVHYRETGTLVVARSGDEAATLVARAADQRARGLAAEWLDAAGARALEPGLAADVVGALHLPDDHQVDNVALVQAAAAALAARPGLAVRTGVRVEGLALADGRVAGVETSAGRVAAGAVVLAAGAWSGRLPGLPRRIPVRPIRGQMVALRPTVPPIRRIVGGRSVYCVPRQDGRVLIGATVEDVGFDRCVQPAAIAALKSAAAAVVPALADALEDARWSGLRPATADDLPVIGADPLAPGLVYATGHYRNGILLAPLTAAWVAALLQGEPLPMLADAFGPARFGEGP